MTADAFHRRTELDRTNWPELRDHVLQFEPDQAHAEPRRYPGYPRWPLERVRARLWPSLDRTLRDRRSQRQLATALPARKILSRLLYFAHGIHDTLYRGPTPSAGCLQALELYLVHLGQAWLPSGLYHYDRVSHHLAQIDPTAERGPWQALVPSLALVDGGSLVWVLVGDGARIEKKYSARGYRFLLLEAGHLMQNLCLLSASLGLSTVPLGGFFEAEVAEQFHLPKGDHVLYTGCLGSMQP